MKFKFWFSHKGSTDIKSVGSLVFISPKNVSRSKALYNISKHTGVLHRQTGRQTDRPLAHQPATTLEVHPPMATYQCSLRMFTAALQILHSPQDIPQCNRKNMLPVLLVTLNVHLEELSSLQQCREVVFSHTGLTTVHEFYEWLEHWKLHILQHYQRVHAQLSLQYCL